MLSLVKRLLAGVAIVSVLGVMGVWVLQARDSDLFRIQTIELTGLEGTGLKRLPVSRETILSMLGIQKGQTSLFQVSLADLEEKFATVGWIRHVDLRKRFPSTFAVHVEFRKPIAFLQGREGELQYVDEDGVKFGPVDTQIAFDLPVVTLLEGATQEQLKNALSLLTATTPTVSGFEVSSMEIDAKGSMRVIITYPLLPANGRTGGVPTARAVLPWSQDLDAMKVIPRISKVIQYLRDHSIPARALLLGDGKKIIVKTARGS